MALKVQPNRTGFYRPFGNGQKLGYCLGTWRGAGQTMAESCGVAGKLSSTLPASGSQEDINSYPGRLRSDSGRHGNRNTGLKGMMSGRPVPGVIDDRPLESHAHFIALYAIGCHGVGRFLIKACGAVVGRHHGARRRQHRRPPNRLERLYARRGIRDLAIQSGRAAPAGTQGYLQPVEFEEATRGPAHIALDVAAANGAVTSLHGGEDSRIGAGGAPLPDHVDAPLVFVGYGLHLPKQGYDDFADVDVRGKVVVVLSGNPARYQGPIKSNARFARDSLLGKMGAVGIIALTTPHQVEIPGHGSGCSPRNRGCILRMPAYAKDRTAFSARPSIPTNQNSCSQIPDIPSPSYALSRMRRSRAL